LVRKYTLRNGLCSFTQSADRKRNDQDAKEPKPVAQSLLGDDSQILEAAAKPTPKSAGISWSPHWHRGLVDFWLPLVLIS